MVFILSSLWEDYGSFLMGETDCVGNWVLGSITTNKASGASDLAAAAAWNNGLVPNWDKGYILSPCLFNFYAEYIIWNARLLLLSHFSRVRLCATPQTAAHQAPLSLGFSRQEHWSGLPFPSPMHGSEKWMKHKLESRLLEEISIISDMQMIPPLWQKAKKNWRASWWKWKRRVKS